MARLRDASLPGNLLARVIRVLFPQIIFGYRRIPCRCIPTVVIDVMIPNHYDHVHIALMAADTAPGTKPVTSVA
jgi:hypothetical protein